MMPYLVGLAQNGIAMIQGLAGRRLRGSRGRRGSHLLQPAGLVVDALAWKINMGRSGCVSHQLVSLMIEC